MSFPTHIPKDDVHPPAKTKKDQAFGQTHPGLPTLFAAYVTAGWAVASCIAARVEARVP